MHIYTLHQWQHSHHFGVDNPRGERNTWRVILFTLSMMIVEIIAGLVYGSMALLADGWHMGGTHATHYPKSVEHYKKLLDGFAELAHVTIEVNQCESEPCLPLSPHLRF